MILITQFIYLIPGREATFDQFEEQALPLIAKYQGKLLLRLRPGTDSIIESNTDTPYEIHFVEFPSENELNLFFKDETRNKFLHLKEASVRHSTMFKQEKS
jgi:hypothetical protein